MCKIHIVLDSGVKSFAPDDLHPRHRIAPAKKPVRLVGKTPTSRANSIPSVGQCSVPHSPRFNGVGEIDPDFYEKGSKRRGPESRHRRHTLEKARRRTAMAEV